MNIFPVGDTTFASDPKGRHKSHTVYTTKTGQKSYALVDGSWHYAHPVFPIGFRVGRRVPKNLAARLQVS